MQAVAGNVVFVFIESEKIYWFRPRFTPRNLATENMWQAGVFTSSYNREKTKKQYQRNLKFRA